MRSVELVGIFSIRVANLRLTPAILVGRAHFQRIPSRARDLPFVAPPAPDHTSRRRRELRRLPGSATHPHLDAGDLTLSCPGNTLHSISLDPNLLAFRWTQKLRIHLYGSQRPRCAMRSQSDVLLI